MDITVADFEGPNFSKPKFFFFKKFFEKKNFHFQIFLPLKSVTVMSIYGHYRDRFSTLLFMALYDLYFQIYRELTVVKYAQIAKVA